MHASIGRAAHDLEILDRFAHGYLDITRDFLTPVELDRLPFSAKLMTLECMRFLTDYLNCDVYYKALRESRPDGENRREAQVVLSGPTRQPDSRWQSQGHHS